MTSIPINTHNVDELYYPDQRLQQYSQPVSIKSETKRTTTESLCTYYCYPNNSNQFGHPSGAYDIAYEQNPPYPYANILRDHIPVHNNYSSKNEMVPSVINPYPIGEMESLLLGIDHSERDLNSGINSAYGEHPYQATGYPHLPPKTEGGYEGWTHQAPGFLGETEQSYYNQLTPSDRNLCDFTANRGSHCQYAERGQELYDCQSPYKDVAEPNQSRKRKRVNQEVRVRLNGRYRTPYDEYVKNALETEFSKNKYISSARKAELVPQLQLTNRQIKIWFQNRRAKDRRLQKRIQET